MSGDQVIVIKFWNLFLERERVDVCEANCKERSGSICSGVTAWKEDVIWRKPNR